MVGKKKMLVTSIFSSSHNVFMRLFFSGLLELLPSSEELTPPQMTNFRLPKLKELTDDNFKIDENGRKLSKQVENTMGKGKIALYKQFSFLPHCFLTHSLINHFETIPHSKRLQTTTEMWLLKYFYIQIA